MTKPIDKTRLHYHLDGTTVTIVAHTGESNSTYTDEEVVKQASFDAADFPHSFTTGSDVTKSLIGYGLQKLLQDRTSGVSGDSVAKLDAMIAEATRLETTSEWSERREAAERTPRGKVDNFLARAVSELQGIPLVQAEASLKALDKEKRDRIAANPRVSELVAQFKAEAKDAAVVDLDGLFDI